MLTRSAATLLVLFVLAARPAAAAPDGINATIGDASWVATHGRAPTAADAEVTRIATHLTFVLAQLRATTPTGHVRRTAALDALARYIARGQFPRRTDDTYAGRRPRFIDDRGVHCAVGQLIADTGAPALARAINAEHEYAYVQDITTPGLAAWARANGFSIRDLAMIQPAYDAPPNRDDTKREIEENKDRIALACAAEHPPLAELTVRVFGSESGRLTVATKRTEPFARCFVTRATKLSAGNGAWDSQPEAYDFTMKLRFTSLHRMFDQHIAALWPADCWPRPGNLARRATVAMISNLEGLTVHASTSPSNEEVDRCIEGAIRHNLAQFGKGHWRLSATRTFELVPRVTTQSLREWVTAYTPRAVRECASAEQLPPRITVSAGAHVDDAHFTITTASLPDKVATCVSEKLNASLGDGLKVWRNAPAGHYIRLDGDAQVTVTVELPR
ncbi:MAG: hypothetical protein SFX73_04190 [Kofleriaceae bacterium]|nr:hypothetical protein [Kofleriaceae bacterium]